MNKRHINHPPLPAPLQDQEQERLEALTQCNNLEAALEELHQQLTEGERQRMELHCELEGAREGTETLSRDMHRRIQELRADIARSRSVQTMGITFS